MAAGKRVAERTRLAREAQKKALAEANIMIEKNKADKAAARSTAANKASSNKERLPPITEEPEPTTTQATEPAESTFTTGQWIAIVGIGVTLATTYVKREDIKALYKRATKPNTSSPEQPQQDHQQQVRSPPPQRNNLRKMD